jgi:molybdopterin converting factor small subunit
LVGEEESGSAFTFFGPVRAGLTTSQATSKEAQLSELLSSLEKEVENLRSKYCEAYITLISVMEHLVKLNSLLLNTDTTKLKDS